MIPTITREEVQKKLAGGEHFVLAEAMGHPAPYGALVLRLSLGLVFLAHALLKLLVFSLPGTAAWFASQGFPSWTAYPVFATELVGSVLLFTGFWSRGAALALVPVMLGALKVHAANGWAFTGQNGGWEYPALVIALLVAHALLGPGALALAAGSLPVWRHGGVVRPPPEPGYRTPRSPIG